MDKKQETKDRIYISMDRDLIEKGMSEAKRRGIKSFSAFMRYLLLKELDRTQRF